MHRACASCGAKLLEDVDEDMVACPKHGTLRAWLVLDQGGAVVAAGRLTLSGGRNGALAESASWLSPAPRFLAVEPLDLRQDAA